MLGYIHAYRIYKFPFCFLHTRTPSFRPGNHTCASTSIYIHQFFTTCQNRILVCWAIYTTTGDVPVHVFVYIHSTHVFTFIQTINSHVRLHTHLHVMYQDMYCYTFILHIQIYIHTDHKIVYVRLHPERQVMC